MIFRSIHLKAFIDIYANKHVLKSNATGKIFKSFFTQNLHSTSRETVPLENQLKEIFKFKNSNVSNWIIEVSNTNYFLIFYFLTFSKFYLIYS